MSPEQFKQRMSEHLAELKAFQRDKLPDIVGTEAVNHFNQSFVNEGFTDETLQKWPDVQRRNASSSWYGYSSVGKNHFSPTRASDKILTGETSELKNATTYIVKEDRVTVRNDKSYAAVHQFGLMAKIFGGMEFTMKARPFIGKSKVLGQNIQAKFQREIKKILKLN